MARPIALAAVLVLATALPACRERTPAALATPRVDTLPSGAFHVRNVAPSAWADTSAWTLVEDLRIGGPDTTTPLEHPAGLAIDTQGRIYVSDGQVKLFDPAGQLIRTVGRDGEGPGEYRSAYLATLGDQLVLQDIALGRLSVFDSSGRFLTSWRTTCCAVAVPTVDTLGRIMVWSPSATAQHQYVRYQPDGRVVDTLRLPPLPPARLWELRTGFGHWSTGIPFAPQAVVGVLPATGLVYGWSGEYTLVATRTGADTAFLFSLAAPPVPLSEARRAAATAEITDFLARNGRNIGGVASEEVARVIRLGDVPTTAPAFEALTADRAGRLWVERGGGDTLHSRYDVFSATGTFLGPVVAPARLARYGATVWTDSSVYTITEDPDGTPAIVRYRLRHGGGA